MVQFYVLLLTAASVANANFFNFFNQQQHQQQQQPKQPLDHENDVLNSQCGRYVCPDTLICVDGPSSCPCPYQSSQLRCLLPDGRYICVSKPAGDFGDRYDDPDKNWKVDAHDDNVRDCGWVQRAWSGVV